MSVLLKIAFRNLKEHRSKTLIIGTLVTIGIAVLVFGNSLMDSATEGIRRTYTLGYTGDLVIAGIGRGTPTLFDRGGFGASNNVAPTIPDYDDVYAFVTEHPAVAAANPQATAFSSLQVEGMDEQRGTFLFGIDPALYRDMFPDNIELIDGRFLHPGEDGIMLSEQIVKRLEESLGRALQPGSDVLLTGTSQFAGIKVREVPVRGIFRFARRDHQTDLVSLVDIGNLRALEGMRLSAVELTEDEAALFDDFDENPLFGGDPDFATAPSLFTDDVPEETEASALFDDWTLFGELSSDGETGMPDGGADEDSKAWHFLLLRLHPDASVNNVKADLETYFTEHDIQAQVIDWVDAAGQVAGFALGLKTFFNVIVIVIAVVAIIIIMNTLVISVTERTTEIGTMRALGAQKPFVRRMIAWETILVSGMFGIIGVLVGSGALWLVSVVGIDPSNVFLELLFGGEVLRPVPSLKSIGTSLVLVVVIGVAASLYPASIALKTKPAAAMQR